MPAGIVTIDFLDGAGATKTGRFWSSDGTTSGTLSPAPLLADSSDAEIDFATAANQTTANSYLDTLATNSSDTSTINVAQDTAVIKNGATSLTPKYAVINLTATGDLVALVSAKKIRVTNIDFVCSAALTLTFTSNATAISGPMSFGANGGMAPGFDPTGHIETAAGEKLALTISGTGTVGGWLKYIEV